MKEELMKALYPIVFVLLFGCSSTPISKGYILNTNTFETSLEFYDIESNSHIDTNLNLDSNKIVNIKYSYNKNELYMFQRLSATSINMIVIDLNSLNIVEEIVFETVKDSETFDFDSGELFYSVRVFNQNKTEVWKTISDRKTNVKLFTISDRINNLNSYKGQVLYNMRNAIFDNLGSFIFFSEDNLMKKISSGRCSLNKWLGKAVSVSSRGIEVYNLTDSSIQVFNIESTFGFDTALIKEIYQLDSNLFIFNYYKRTRTELNFLSWVQIDDEYDIYSLDLDNGVIKNHGYAPGGIIYDVYY